MPNMGGNTITAETDLNTKGGGLAQKLPQPTKGAPKLFQAGGSPKMTKPVKNVTMSLADKRKAKFVK